MALGVGPQDPLTHITIGQAGVSVEVADTPATQALGLSGRESLSTGQGMLFVFDHDERWGMWMKDMRFPIDIVWIDAQRRVVYVVEDARPESYPYVFAPQTPARYVLELPAGFVHSKGIAEGMKMRW